MSRHSPEPWWAGCDEDGHIIYAKELGEQGEENAIAVAGTDRLDGDSQLEVANALRIVACVNACVGIENPESTVPKLAESNRKLTEALKLTVKWMEWWLSNDCCDCESEHICGKTERRRELAIARAALAEAGGGT